MWFELISVIVYGPKPTRVVCMRSATL